MPPTPLETQALSVLHCAAPGTVGGLERVVAALTAGQLAAGCAVHVAAVVDAGAPPNPLVTRLRDAGVDVVAIPLRPRAYREERRRLTELMSQVAPSVVHTHGYRADVQAGAVARTLRVPAVCTVHGFTGGGWRNRCYEALQLRSCRRFDAVVAVSRPLVTRLERAGVPRDRVHLVPNAAPQDPPPFYRERARHALGLSADEFVLGWVGRLSPEKGADVLLRALERVPDSRVQAIFLGVGPERASLESLARSLGIAGRVRWCGAVPDAGRLFSAFDAFVLSSRTEGTPIVLFEAMAAETPIVAAAVGGVPDVVSAEEAIPDPPEDPAAPAAAVQAILADPAGARARALRARRRLEAERQLGPWVARYDAIYRHVARPAFPLAK